jgi:transposase InsO family protein
LNIQTYIIALGVSLHDEPCLEKMAADLKRDVLQIFRVAYRDAAIICRMQRRLVKLAKRRKRANVKLD